MVLLGLTVQLSTSLFRLAFALGVLDSRRRGANEGAARFLSPLVRWRGQKKKSHADGVMHMMFFNADISEI